MENEKELTNISSKCSKCGGNLKFDPNTQSLKCNGCGTTTPFTIEDTCLEHNIKDKPQNYDEYVKWQKEHKMIRCENCGAKVQLKTLEYSSVCPYCDTSLVAVRSTLPNMIPDGILPFMFDEEIAQKHFAYKIKKHFWVSSKFKKAKTKKVVEGMYFPAFSFSAESYSTYDGKLSETEKVRGRDGETRTVTNTFYISGTKDLNHQNITQEVSSRVNQTELNYVLPYDFSKMKKFDEKFILGYNVEHFEIGVSAAYNTAKEKMNQNIRRSILSRYSYDRVHYLNINTIFSNERYKYVLLPIYKFEYKFKNKNFKTYMNGQNGNIGGKFPLDKLKITLTVISIVFIILLIFALIVFGGIKSSL